MGFFKDFKRDFAQAVNELMPDKDELAEEYDDEDMVNTFDENDNMDIAPEDMLEDLDDFKIDTMSDDNNVREHQAEKPESDYEEEDDEPKDVFESIPEAEVINDPVYDEDNTDDLEPEKEAELVTEILVAEPEEQKEETNISEEEAPDTESDSYTGDDDLLAVDALDEENMLEGMEDVVSVESEADKKDELSPMNLNQDVMDAIMMREEASDNNDIDDVEEDDMSEVEAKIDEPKQEIDSILNDDTTYITKGTTIKGNIETDGGVDIIGTVIGDVICGGKLIVGGSIKGSVKTGELYANAAKIEGDVVAEGSAKIGVGSVVVGNVSASSAVVAGAVNGDIDVKGPVIVDSTAVIMGNIKSRSVQINNGAVIEGFCSQCYSEIDVKSFFE